MIVLGQWFLTFILVHTVFTLPLETDVEASLVEQEWEGEGGDIREDAEGSANKHRRGNLFFEGESKILGNILSKYRLWAAGEEAEVESPEWEYSGRLGTEYWGTINPNCLGSSQSPVNLDSNLLVLGNPGGSRIEFYNYEQVNSDTTVLENNGHTVELKVVNPPRQPTMTGGHLMSSYEMAQLHFHWAATDTMGSEHTVDRVPYPLEMHMVHLSTHIASDQQGGLAVAGFFFQITREDNPALEAIIDGIQNIQQAHEETHLHDHHFNVRSLIQGSVAGPYYSYEGSLTTPGCDEVVQWVLYSSPLAISSRQLATFRTVLDAEGESIKMNFRPVQPLNDRIPAYFTK